MDTDLASKGDILIIDDTLDNLRLLSTMLEDQGYDVRGVTSGATALMGIRAQKPDLILLDINMPGMSGWELCQQLKNDVHTQDIPVIFISALTESLDKARAFSIGGVDYISKPFQVEEVIARIENQLKFLRLNIQLQFKDLQLQQGLERERRLHSRLHDPSSSAGCACTTLSDPRSLEALITTLNSYIDSALAYLHTDVEQT